MFSSTTGSTRPILFSDKNTNFPLFTWPVYGWAYDVLIGGLYPGQQPEWVYEYVFPF